VNPVTQVPPRPAHVESASIDHPALTTDTARILSHWMKTGSILTFHRWLLVIGGLIAASVVVLVVCLEFGATPVEIRTVVGAILTLLQGEHINADGLGTPGVIMIQIRLPRVLMGFLVGASLAGIGVTLQALLRNPLADPYVLGVSSGAALGVSLAMLLGIGTGFALLPTLTLFGFLGGLLSLVLIYRLAQSQGRLPVHSLLLAGVILNAILTALIMFITTIMDPNRSAGLMAWLMGSLTAPTYPALGVFVLYVVVVLAILMHKAQMLNVMTLGEDIARSLGIETEWVKKQLFVLTALLTGAVVSVSGMIGFVGMVIPHVVRMLVGSDHRLLFPASALVGGMFLVVSDTIARTLLAPSEIPVGIVTALAGGPFFLYLLLCRKDRMN